jgi:hypothetical protein
LAVSSPATSLGTAHRPSCSSRSPCGVWQISRYSLFIRLRATIPIHGKEAARFCLSAIRSSQRPRVQPEIARVESYPSPHSIWAARTVLTATGLKDALRRTLNEFWWWESLGAGPASGQRIIWAICFHRGGPALAAVESYFRTFSPPTFIPVMNSQRAGRSTSAEKHYAIHYEEAQAQGEPRFEQCLGILHPSPFWRAVCGPRVSVSRRQRPGGGDGKSNRRLRICRQFRGWNRICL